MADLIIISAPSGAGKTTLARKLLQNFPELKQSISSTTRAPRNNEQQGIDYFFMSHQEFQQLRDSDGFAEWAEVHGNYYGTPKAFLEEAIRAHQPLLLVIDIQGAKAIKRLYQQSCYSIFIIPPSLEELETRLRIRGTDSEATIQKRLANAKTEMAKKSEFDAIIVNNSLERAYEELKNLVQKLITQESTVYK